MNEYDARKHTQTLFNIAVEYSSMWDAERNQAIMRAYLDAYREAAFPPKGPMWVVKTPDGYKLYKDEQAARAIADEQLYAWTEEDVQSYLDELSDDQTNTYWMGTAASYLEDRGLATDRVSHYYSHSVYDVSGLKDLLCKKGWIEFLTLLQLEYRVLEVTEATS